MQPALSSESSPSEFLNLNEDRMGDDGLPSISRSALSSRANGTTSANGASWIVDVERRTPANSALLARLIATFEQLKRE